MSDAVLTADASLASDAATRDLSTARRGQAGVIVAVRGDTGAPEAVAAEELERRLLEMGFVEGARIEILQEGLSAVIPWPCGWTTPAWPCAAARRAP
jgi:ferrous iron transport protein A